MKKCLALTGIGLTAIVLSYCTTSQRATGPDAHKVTYTDNVSRVIQGNCSPCHIPSKGGNKKAFDNFVNVSAEIDEILRRIELNPTDKGFMPFRKAHRLPDSTIAVFKLWKADGMVY